MTHRASASDKYYEEVGYTECERIPAMAAGRSYIVWSFASAPFLVRKAAGDNQAPHHLCPRRHRALWPTAIPSCRPAHRRRHRRHRRHCRHELESTGGYPSSTAATARAQAHSAAGGDERRLDHQRHILRYPLPRRPQVHRHTARRAVRPRRRLRHPGRVANRLPWPRWACRLLQQQRARAAGRKPEAIRLRGLGEGEEHTGASCGGGGAGQRTARLHEARGGEGGGARGGRGEGREAKVGPGEGRGGEEVEDAVAAVAEGADDDDEADQGLSRRHGEGPGTAAAARAASRPSPAAG